MKTECWRPLKRSEAFLHVTVRTRLTGIEADSSRDPVLRKSARDALDALAQRASRYELLETLFFGLSLGSILVLAAIGLSITFGVMGVINMAHGELIMLGAYTTYVMQQLMPEWHRGWRCLLSIPMRHSWWRRSVGIAYRARRQSGFSMDGRWKPCWPPSVSACMLQQAVRSHLLATQPLASPRRNG